MPHFLPVDTRVFATVQYDIAENQLPRVVLPTRCVFVTPSENDCRVHVDHYRDRKTGPCFPIAVLCCVNHPIRRFTAYPPGHFPFGRSPLLAVSLSGPMLRDGDSGKPSLECTQLQAATDAAIGCRWPDECVEHEPATRRTQGHRLEFAGLLFGVDPELADQIREEAAARLHVPTMVLREASARWLRCWTSRGLAVTAVVAAMIIDGTLLDRLLSAGYASGLWPRPARWCPQRRVWLRAHLLPAIHGARAPPTTSLGDSREEIGAASVA